MQRLPKAIRRFKNPRDLWLFAQILFELLILPGRIKRQSLPSLLAQLDPGVALAQSDETRLLKTVRFVDVLLHYPILCRYGKCMMRSLLLFKFLRRQGWPVEIHFGVKRVEEGRPDITGHSWLVLNKEKFLEAEQGDDYITTYSYPI